MAETTAADFPLDRVAAGLKETAYRLEHGQGITLIRGIPVDRYELDDLKRSTSASAFIWARR